ncbi:MAG: hypothetical protein NC388_04270 [Clostridium sp.]|nr:hypothetical protein [Clostridium sp.]
MKKSRYTTPALTVIDLEVEDMFLDMSITNGTVDDESQILSNDTDGDGSIGWSSSLWDD